MSLKAQIHVRAQHLLPLKQHGTRSAFAFLCLIVALSVGMAHPQIVFAAPAAPTLSGVAGNAQNTLSWSAVSGATSYTLKNGSTTIYSGTALTKTDTGLTNGTVYNYTVTATDLTGTSASSNTVSLTPTYPAPTQKPSLSGYAGDAKNYLHWSAVDTTSAYVVYRDGTQIYSGTAQTYTDSSLTNGTNYGYYVRATNGGGASESSNSVTLTPQLTPTAATDPQNITPRDEQIIALGLTIFVSYLVIKQFSYRGTIE